MKKPQRLPQKTVRVGAFERRMDRIHAEIEGRQKDTEWTISCVLAEYHERFVEPLEAKIAWLETPWWRRVWVRVRGWAARGCALVRRLAGTAAQKPASLSEATDARP